MRMKMMDKKTVFSLIMLILGVALELFAIWGNGLLSNTWSAVIKIVSSIVILMSVYGIIK
ncbi:hypothetical protein [Apilactobacillus bombintestini]|uniref:Uncharacterized protein n=1 Tax=Apilactobacillus bombintestini TaxID=2419772 RepID=A0A387APX7_9LACO|nr:hypothetical protein [Apilactobacillus bombintestini]AYF92027.1 hypothetical protein D7I45_00260 [Apilactobacillus bombintestini]